MAAASILAAGVGGSYVLWGSYGDQLEQAVMASVRTSATWLQQIRSNDWLASPKAAATVEKIVESQQTEAAYVTNVPQNARKDEPTSPTVAHPTPEGSAPKPGNGSIESERGSQGLGNLGSPSTSSATELSPSPTRRGEPDTKSQLPRSNALDKNRNPERNTTYKADTTGYSTRCVLCDDPTIGNRRIWELEEPRSTGS